MFEKTTPLEKPASLYVVNALSALTFFLLIAAVLVSIVAVSQASTDTMTGQVLVGWIEGLGFDPETYSYTEAGQVLGMNLFSMILTATTSLAVSYRQRNLALIMPALWAIVSCTSGGFCGGFVALVCVACVLMPQSQSYLSGVSPDANTRAPGGH